MLPVDVVVAGEIAEDARTGVVGVDHVGGDRMILDVGPETARRFADADADAADQTGPWSGTVR